MYNKIIDNGGRILGPNRGERIREHENPIEQVFLLFIGIYLLGILAAAPLLVLNFILKISDAPHLFPGISDVGYVIPMIITGFYAAICFRRG